MISIGKETAIPNTPYMNGTPHRFTIACILPHIFRLLVWNLATLVFLFSLTLPACDDYPTYASIYVSCS